MRVLLTAFEPFGRWEQNSSALCLNEMLTRRALTITPSTRIYAVDFDKAQGAVEEDLRQGFDLALHLGQHEVTPSVRLERIARNIGVPLDGQAQPLAPDAPSELKTNLPLRRWSQILRRKGVPVAISQDAGCYVCNAVYYWSLYSIQKYSLRTRSAFIHIPLANTQVEAQLEHLPSLGTETAASAVEILVADWVSNFSRTNRKPSGGLS